MMVACTGQGAKDAPVANADSTEVQAEAQEAAPAKIEKRANYQLAVPAGWESSQNQSTMVLRKDGIKVEFENWSGSEVAENILGNFGCKAENKLDDVTTELTTWTGYKDANDFKKIYFGVIDGKTVVRVGSTDADLDLKPILEAVAKREVTE